SRGKPGWHDIDHPGYTLRPGDRIHATRGSSVQFYVQLGGSHAYCQTYPSKGALRVNPEGGVLIDFRGGNSICGVIAGATSCLQGRHHVHFRFKSPNAQSECSSGFRTMASSSASPAVGIMQITAGRNRTVLTVRKGAAVVTANGAGEQ